MKPSGTLYKRGYRKTHGELKVSLTQKQKRLYKKIRLLGAVLASFSITYMLFFYAPVFLLDFEFIESKLNINIPSEPVLAQEDLSAALEMTNDDSSVGVSFMKPVAPDKSVVGAIHESPSEEIAVNQFDIYIPAIDAKSNVVYNVDPFDSTKYLSALKQGVAHAKDTALPGQGGRVYLFAHSTNSPLNFTKYNAIFYQLRLLSKGDLIEASLNGDTYKYKVTEKHIVAASDTSWLTEKSDRDQLILQTCDPPGTTLRRLLVVAERV